MIDMSLILGGVLMPKFGPNGFKRSYQPNETDNVTLGGNMFTDFINNRRIWLVTWENITAAQFALIHEVYLSQYSDYTYPIMQMDAYDIYTPVKMEMDDQNIRWNGSIVSNLTVRLIEKYAFS